MGHMPPSEARTKKGVLGAEVGHAPDILALHAIVGPVGHGRAVGQHELGIVQQLPERDRPFGRGQRGARRHDRNHFLAEQAFGRYARGREWECPGDAETASSVEHHLRDRAQRFHVQPERCRSEALFEIGEGIGQAALPATSCVPA